MSGWVYPAVIAHRCGGALAPENTLTGLEIAARLGCKGVEFDVMLSADGVPVLIHDESLARTTGHSGRVCEMPAEALCRLDAGRHHHPSFAGTLLPAFAHAAEACLRLGLAANIEIKPAAGFEAQTGQVVAQMAARLWQGRQPPLLSSFSVEALQAAHLAAPALPRALLVEAVPADWQMRCAATGAIALHVESTQLNAEQVAAIKAAGFGLAVYTENAPGRAHELMSWGVDAIVTDRPDLLRS